MQVAKGRIITETLGRILKLRTGEGLLLQPYKKDRSVYVIRRETLFQVVEYGFRRKEYHVEEAKLGKLLKKVCRNEFPRSNRVWLNLCSVEDMEDIVKQLR